MEKTLLTPTALSANLQNILHRIPRTPFLIYADIEYTEPFLENDDVRFSWLRDYPILSFLYFDYRSSFNGRHATAETPFLNGLIIGISAFIHIAEDDAARGWPDFSQYLKCIPDTHFNKMTGALSETTAAKFPIWKEKYPCFLAALDLKLTYEARADASEIGKSRYEGILCAVALLILASETIISQTEEAA